MYNNCNDQNPNSFSHLNNYIKAFYFSKYITLIELFLVQIQIFEKFNNFNEILNNALHSLSYEFSNNNINQNNNLCDENFPFPQTNNFNSSNLNWENKNNFFPSQENFYMNQNLNFEMDINPYLSDSNIPFNQFMPKEDANLNYSCGNSK